MNDTRKDVVVRRIRSEMHRRIFVLTSALAIASSTGFALAQDITTSILAQLRDLGFEQIELQRTLLGRTRIIATNAEGHREIIVNPNSGEILRDLWVPADGYEGTSRLVNNGGGVKGGGSGASGRSDGSGGDDGSGSGDGSSGSGSQGGNSGSSGSGGDDDDGDSGSGSDSGGSGSNSGSDDSDNNGSKSGSSGSGGGSGSGQDSGSSGGSGGSDGDDGDDHN